MGSRSISRPDQGDAGEFSCIASNRQIKPAYFLGIFLFIINRAGSSNTTASLTVEFPPSVDAGQVIIISME